MGRKYKILKMSEAHLTKKQQEAKFNAEFLAADGLKKISSNSPAWIKTDAKKEYKRIVESLGSLPIRDLDHAELELYATWYATYKKTAIDLNNGDLTEGQRDRLISRLDKATKNIKGLASDLGLNVNSRMQMNIPKTEEAKSSIMDRFG